MEKTSSPVAMLVMMKMLSVPNLSPRKPGSIRPGIEAAFWIVNYIKKPMSNLDNTLKNCNRADLVKSESWGNVVQSCKQLKIEV